MTTESLCTGPHAKSYNWSTQDVEPANASTFWAKTLSERMPGLQYEPLERRFQGSLHQHFFGGLGFSAISATPQRILRKPAPRGRVSAPQFDLIYVRAGRLKVQHGARLFDVGAGECTLINTSETSEVITCLPTDTLCISLPGLWLKQWLARPEVEAAKAFTASVPRARPLLHLLALLCDEHASELGVGGDLIATQLGGALALTVGAPCMVGTTHSTKLLSRLKQALWARTYDQDYCAAIAAAEAGISRRYLVALFAGEGTTFNTELMRMRLEKAAHMLCDPRFVAVSVTEISYRCGFSDPSHFSKRFREKFGTSPANYRSTTFRLTTEAARQTGSASENITL